MSYPEEDFLQLSGLQHFRFCRRQWALIHIENQWAENLRTTEGHILHERAHDASFREKRGELLITRDMRVFSHTLGLSGACDVVEFCRASEGIPLAGQEGNYLPYPVEYKHGTPQTMQADGLQLCAQAMCLEEMLCCDIPSGALFYKEIQRRVPVTFSPELRQEVQTLALEMHQLYQKGHTPRVKPTKSCNACSLKELCLPKLMRTKTVSRYIAQKMEELP